MKHLIEGLVLLLIIGNMGVVCLAFEKRVYVTHRIEGTPLNIDGRLDDPAWETVSWSGDFIQRTPHEGLPPSQQTSFKILYDDDFLYIAFRCFDSEPELISTRLSRRDGFDGDWIEINIDSLLDYRTAFSFTASVSGVQGDEFVSADGQYWDGNWDPIWYFETNIDELGWTAEVKIPLNQLRFNKKDEHIWGIQITRRIFRVEERSNWQDIPRESTGWVSLFGELHGIKGLEPQRQIELIPYAVARHERFPREEGNPWFQGERNEFDGGLDGKVGVTNDMILDFTINPDFGQIEADPSEVNLTAFETFFQEKRPFFIEGRTVLDYPLTPAMFSGDYSSDTLFYSRRIGRAPHKALTNYADSDYYVDMPDATTILGALKLIGKTKDGLTIGILEGVTDNEHARVHDAGQEYRERVEPLTNYFIARVQQDLDQGNTIIGGIVTTTNRDVSDDDMNDLHRSAITGGVDLFHQWADKAYYVAGNIVFSQVRGDREAIYQTQTSSTHYFQRPDAEHVSLDEERTSLSGHGGLLKFGKSSGERFRYETGLTWRSPGLELNDLGYLRSDDRLDAWTWIGYQILNPFSIYNYFSLNMNVASQWDFSGENQQNLLNVNSHAEFRNFWKAQAGAGYQGESISRSALRGGPSLKVPGGLSWNYTIETDFHRQVYGQFGSDGYHGEDDSSSLVMSGFSVSYRPSNALRLTLNPSYWLRRDDDEFVSTAAVSKSQDHYIFGRIRQTTFLMTVRLDYTLTPRLTIQYYGQPFISSGSYSRFKRVSDPRASSYHDRYHYYHDDEIDFEAGTYSIDENQDGLTDYSFDNPDFDVQLFVSNLVVRWEYSPGSTFYLVWSQNREAFLTTGDFMFRDNLDHLFSIQPHNVFLIKVNYWLPL